jgi:polyphosphate glucokinase
MGPFQSLEIWGLVGSALISQRPYKRGQTLGAALGSQALKRYGKAAWSRVVKDIVPILIQAFLADTIVLGGGQAKKLKAIPPGARLGHNLTAFRGGFRMWNADEALPGPGDKK